MPHWTLECPGCKVVFNHSEIPEHSFTEHAFMGIAAKPNFPEGGLRIICPSCGQISVKQSYELIYSHF